jgi:hypothetical protein
MPQTKDQFAKILIESVDYSLLLLGESARKAVYFHLERDYSITREKVPENIEAFVNGLESIFGAGALVIERSILNNLHSKLGLEHEEMKNFRFIDSLNRAKEIWLNGSQTETIIFV